MAGQKTSVYLLPEIQEELDKRGARSTVISRDLERLYGLYKRSLAEISLTESEACLIVDVLNATIMDVRSALYLWMEVEDGIRLEGLADKWGVDGPALVEKLRNLSAIQALALVDAAERFWADPKYHSDTCAGVRECFGLAIKG